MGFLAGFIWNFSLALPIGVHLGWNWAQGHWTPILHERPTWLTGGPVGLEGSAVCAGVIGLLILGMTFLKSGPISDLNRSGRENG